MRIVYLTVSVNYVSGGMRVILEHADRLKQRHHNVEIWTMEREIKPWLPCKTPIYFINDAISHSLDILVITDASFLFNDFWKKITAKKYFFLVQHDIELICRESGNHIHADQLKELFHRTFPKEIRIIAVSRWIQERFFQQYQADSILVRNGIDAGLFHQTLPLLQNQTQRLLFFYDPQTWKGISDIISAINVIKKTYFDVGIIAVGGVMPSLFGNSSVTQGQHWSFFWPVIYFNHPLQEDLAKIYSSASVFISSSWCEGFGLPGLEAMACGVPVVTTDSGGIKEYAVNEKTALVVPPRNPQALADGISRILNNEQLRNKLIKNGLKKVKEFNWGKSIDELEKVFKC